MNFFLGLYDKFTQMGANGKDLDHMLSALTWKEIKRKKNGSIIYECKIKNEKKK